MQYNDGIPENSRFSTLASSFKKTVDGLKQPEGQEKVRKVRELTKIAEGTPRSSIYRIWKSFIISIELGATPSALALAWVARNPNTSTVILGASSPQQVIDNLKALDVIPKLNDDIMEKIEKILDNAPTPIVCNFPWLPYRRQK